MSEWKINNVLAETLGVIDIQFTFGNMDPDVARLDLNLDYDASVPTVFEFGQMVGISLDGVQVFYGESQGPTRSGTGCDHLVTVDVTGGWSELEAIPFIGSVSDVVTGSSFSSADPTIAAGTITTQVQTVLSGAVATAAGARLKVGTIDLPAMSVPSVQVMSNTVAQVLKTVLKWVPGVQVVFDYSAAGGSAYPTIHVLQLASSAIASVSQSSLLSLTMKQRTDMVPLGVKIVYQRAGSWTTRTYNAANPLEYTDSVTQGTTLVGTESAGVVSPARNVVIATVSLRGSRSAVRSQYSVPQPLSGLWPYVASTPTVYPYYMYILIGDLLKMFNCPGMVYASYTWVSSMYWYWTPYGDRPICKSVSWSNNSYEGYGSGNYDPNCRWLFPPGKVTPAAIRAGAYAYGASTWKAGFASARLTTGWSSAWNVAADRVHTFDFPAGSFGWLWNQVDMEPSSFKSPGGYTLTKDGTTTSDDAEAAPVSGLAAQYWSLLSTVYNQGSMSSLLTSINPFARAITLAGVKTPVQQVVVSASAMRSDLNFGPPDHLQPQDLLTILQAVAKR